MSILSSSDGTILKVQSNGDIRVIPTECIYNFGEAVKEGRIIRAQREYITKRVKNHEKEMKERTSEAVSMTKTNANTKGGTGSASKKLNKKQLREEKEKQDKENAEYDLEMRKEIIQQAKAFNNDPELLGTKDYSQEYMNQLICPQKDILPGVYHFAIVESNLYI